MNRLKTIFISVFILFLAVALLHAGLELSRRGVAAAAWSGVALAAAANLSFFARLFANGSTRTTEPLSQLLAATVIGTLLTAFGVAIGPVTGGLPLLYASLATFGCLLYVFWYSRSTAEKTSI